MKNHADVRVDWMTERVPTGVAGLDQLIEGGLPKGRVILVMGEPGAGKTIFSVQFLVQGILERGEKAAYFFLEETRSHLISEMSTLGWDLEKFEKDGKLILIDAYPLRLVPPEVQAGTVTVKGRDLLTKGFIDALERVTTEFKPRRVVVDSITSLILQYDNAVQRRRAVFDLMDALTHTGATCVVTREEGSIGLRRGIEVEEFLAHGVITLQSLRAGSSIVRAVQVQKMRQTACNTQPKPYVIGNRGLEVFHTGSVLD